MILQCFPGERSYLHIFMRRCAKIMSKHSEQNEKAKDEHRIFETESTELI